MSEQEPARPGTTPGSVQARHAAATEKAAGYLASRSYRILDRNWRCTAGDLALVAADRDTLVAVVVKAGSRGRYGRPLAAVGAARLRLLRSLAVQWQHAHGTRYDQIRVDVVGVISEGASGCTIEHVKEAG